MKFIKWFLAFSLLTSSVAQAAFVGQNIAADGDGYVEVIDSQTFSLYSSDNGIDGVSDNFYSFTYTDVASTDLYVNFNWSYLTLDEDGSATGDLNQGIYIYLDPVGYLSDGVKTQLNSAVLPYFGSETGTGSFFVAAGSRFGFYADTDDNVAGRGVLTISNFSITPVPEPETAALMLVGLVLIGRFSQKRTFSF